MVGTIVVKVILLMSVVSCRGLLLEANQECPVLEQQLVDTQDKVKLLEEEIKLLKVIFYKTYLNFK